MNGSYLITNNSNPSEKELLIVFNTYAKPLKPLGNLENFSDIKIVNIQDDKKSIGIHEVKVSLNFLNDKPFYYPFKLLIIKNADKMTIEAQNSILKILEEPPSSAVIILCARTEGSLLNTVVSRCKKVTTKPTEEPTLDTHEVPNIADLTIDDRLNLIEELSKDEKEDIITYLQLQISIIRRDMLKEKNSKKIGTYVKAITSIEDRITDLDKLNINTKLALEELVINL
jgi:DNA polymerase III gamma/tau subunit